MKQKWAATIHHTNWPTNVSVVDLKTECQPCSVSVLLVPLRCAVVLLEAERAKKTLLCAVSQCSRPFICGLHMQC
jgi:hypothetical protein